MNAKDIPRIPTTPLRSQCMQDLSAVTTITEACALWHVNKSTLVRWVNEGRIIATKPQPGDTWLISVRHLNAVLGRPKLSSYDPNVLDSRLLHR